MNTTDKIYEHLKEIAAQHKIKFACSVGRHYSGELCLEYNEKEGYVLYAYDRDEETYHYSSFDLKEFEFVVFSHLCSCMGFDYELLNRNKSVISNQTSLESDTRKVAFERALFLLNSINPLWMERMIPEYEGYLRSKGKYEAVFDRNSMEFKEVTNNFDS